MIDAAFVSFAVQKLGDFLIQEASLRLNLRQDVQWLQNELFFIKSFLKDAEQKQVEDQRVQQWIFEINSVANEAVAILETYSFEASKIDDDGFASRLKACACICRKEKKFYDFANEIQSLKQRIMDDVETFLVELVKAEPRRSVISIYGMGGLGNVRKLYNSPKIVSSFYSRAWICVSQEYNTMDLLTTIVKSIQGRTKETLDLLERMTETDLEIYLLDLLKERKYLVVVDDLWHREAWESLKRAFPDSKNGSRVIITTRKEDDAERADNKWLWIALWIAEGFVPRGEEIMEDVAEGFLNELIRRSLIQVVLTFWEKVSKCRIHDLLRDLAVQKALEVNFFDIYDPRKHSISSLCLRHAIHSQGKRYISLDLSNLKLRSLMFLDPDFLKMSLIKFRNVFQHLYVLYLEIRVDTTAILPDAIGSLYHLKFLRLRGIHDLPSSIGKLKNLQTLVVNDYGYSCQLPWETTDLINLRHLVAPYSKPLKRISKLTSLQVVKGIHCDQWKDVDPVDLINLRELSMHHIMNSYSLNNISSLKNLSTLRLLCKDYESFPDIEFLISCQKLHKLYLEGRIEKLPLFPNSITMMYLYLSKLTEDPMPILGMLPNLRNLDLFRAYEGIEITCSDNSFSQLEFLCLDCLENLETWHLATSAMPRIKGIGIHRCPKLYEIPERMKDVERIHFR